MEAILFLKLMLADGYKLDGKDTPKNVQMCINAWDEIRYLQFTQITHDKFSIKKK